MKSASPTGLRAIRERLSGTLQGDVRLPAALKPKRLAQQWRRSFGTPGLLAVCALALCAFAYVFAIVPTMEKLEEARISAAFLHERNMRAAKDVRQAVATPADQLAEFYRKFPAERRLTDALERLVTAAEEHGIALNEGEYRITQDKAGRLMRFHMTFPVKGEYPAIRKLLTGMPAVLPFVAVENVEFERQKVGDPTVQARVRLVLYVERS